MSAPGTGPTEARRLRRGDYFVSVKGRLLRVQSYVAEQDMDRGVVARKAGTEDELYRFVPDAAVYRLSTLEVEAIAARRLWQEKEDEVREWMEERTG